MLSNPDKRARYDQFGHEGNGSGAGGFGGSGGGAGGFGGGFTMEDIFRDFGDIFGGHFGGGFSGGGFNSGGGRNRVNRGSDLRIKVKLTLKEIVNGTTKKLKINKQIACDQCGGTGAKDKDSYATCTTCNGSGYVTQVVNTFFGRTQTSQPCPTCHGEGKIITTPCSKCHGEGVVRGEEVIRNQNSGRSGRGDGAFGQRQRQCRASRRRERRPGSVLIEEEPDKDLVRDGNDLIYNLNITFPAGCARRFGERCRRLTRRPKLKSNRARRPAKCCDCAEKAFRM